MPILGTIASSTRQGLSTNSYESIQTITVGAGGQNTIDFTSIPSTYQHLEVRAVARNTNASNGTMNIGLRFNNNGSNYSWHWLYGTGTFPLVTAASGNDTYSYIARIPMDGTLSDTYGPIILTILDYKNTNKNKSIRGISGASLSGSQDVVWYTGGAWYNTSAITSLSLVSQSGDFKQYSTFALYGIKVAP